MLPDTGTLRTDLLALFARVARRADSMMSEAIAGVMGEAFRHPEVTALLRERLDSAPLSKGIWRIVDRAIERGELADVLIPPRALRLPLDLIRAEAIVCGSPVAEETIIELVDNVYLPLLKGLTRD